MVERAKSANSQLSRQVAGPGSGRETIGRLVRENFTQLFFARLAPRSFICDEIPAAETATIAGDAGFGRRSQIGESRAGSERAGRQGHDGDRLVCSITGWQARGGLAFQRRQRRRHASLLRNRDRKTAAGHHRARAVSHGGRQRGLERGRHRNLLYAFPPEGGAAGRRSEFLSADLFSQTRHR